MKKRAIILTLAIILLVAALLIGASANTRMLDTDYSLRFDGTTAICETVVMGESKNDFIQVTMKLLQGDTLLKSWYKEGYFQFEMKETYAGLETGKLYTLEISSIINGVQQPAVSTKRTLTGSTVPTSKPTTPTTQPTVLPTIQPTVPPTSQPTTPQLAYPAITPSSPAPNYSTGYGHIHYEDADRYWKEYDLFDCVVGQLYWMDKQTHKVTLLLAEQVRLKCDEGPYIYLVKKAEPTKIYRMLIRDPSQIELVVDSIHGEINDISFYPGVKNYLQYTADNKKFVVFEMNTGEETVMMEQPHIEFANIGGKSEGVLSDWVWFYGSIAERENYIGYYFYNRVTGEIQEDEDCSD